ncbi:MAG: nickel pincer cofactor biosynthesis protein LarB [Bacteroidota bacterium]
MTKEELTRLLRDFKKEKLTEQELIQRLLSLESESLGYAHIDHHRHLRKGFPEVIFGEGKTPLQTAGIAAHVCANGEPLLVTRAGPEHFKAVKRKVRGARYHFDARVITANEPKKPDAGKGIILIITAGTSDIPVAEEAYLTAMMAGNIVEKLYDVGVAGIHRLLKNSEQLYRANVVVVVAGMEGALPSVVGGLVDVPVIAVPTSVGYGASFKGIAALLGMLNSCASGVTVVNIDNGFGAGFAASLMNRKR